MKIVIAPDSYKESLSALEVATEIETGFREISILDNRKQFQKRENYGQLYP